MKDPIKLLIRAYDDGVITPKQLEELERLLREDPTAREQYGFSHMTGNYAQIAEAMGATGITVTKTAEMGPAIQKARELNAAGTTVLIDVHSNFEPRKSRF